MATKRRTATRKAPAKNAPGRRAPAKKAPAKKAASGKSRNPGGGRPANRKAPRGKGTAATRARTAMKSPSLDEQRLQGRAGRDPNDANRTRNTPVKASRTG